MRKPDPAVGQRWRFCGREGVVLAIHPGGGGDRGIAEFSGGIAPAHVSTMVNFGSWQYIDDAHVGAVKACGPVAVMQGDAVLVSDDGIAVIPARAGRPLRAIAEALFGWME